LSRFLLDTNILSEPTHSTPHPRVLAKLAEHRYELATAAVVWHAKERTRLTSLGKTSTFADGQIAAIAYVHDLILVTRNQSDFANFENLLIENWFADEPAR